MTGRQVTRRFVDVSERLAPSIQGSINPSRIRKAVVTSHREESAKGKLAVSDLDLASQMTHDVDTANEYYKIADPPLHVTRNDASRQRPRLHDTGRV